MVSRGCSVIIMCPQCGSATRLAPWIAAASLRPARAGATVRCVAECYRVTRQVAFTRAVAHAGDEADPLATSAGTFMVFDDTQSSHAAAGLLDPKP